MSYLYAIRHKSTGRFLPRPKSGQKGGSWVEPTSPDEKQPRFFHRELDAKGFLTVWCQGPLVRTTSYDYETGIPEDMGLEPDLSKALEPRIKDEYEVVKIYWGVVE